MKADELVRTQPEVVNQTAGDVSSNQLPNEVAHLTHRAWDMPAVEMEDRAATIRNQAAVYYLGGVDETVSQSVDPKLTYSSHVENVGW
ncbi:UNVERIFIED_CONTAM: hypothetical protein KB579_01975 [Streptococcus canis]|uniref:hypothetical protein n=1 Tax=Streptococcus canis TaxID=1329 RepID=UPI00242E670F|nr:hypothetical protein [Streptococcus canis]